MIYVDIPTEPISKEDVTWKAITTFKKREDAIKFCKEVFGADDEGRVNLISGSEEDDDTQNNIEGDSE